MTRNRKPDLHAYLGLGGWLIYIEARMRGARTAREIRRRKAADPGPWQAASESARRTA